ncbi:transglutaminase-like domain-containing protein [Alteromonas flava]|uniref:transglutaminase-like domain-containing protein n=1 Tax=Alteromonas flava TaxID=2048003 RepID=UPI000C288C4B|nr:transglutaminase family protein [Alteromonas flava]
MPDLLTSTRLLNYSHADIQALVSSRQWRQLPVYERIGAIYDFVRNEIAFGYNADDAISASQVLHDGYGQCNTKTTLLMALFRAVDIPCRFHGFTIHQALQKGAIPHWLYALAPQKIIHSWVEIEYAGQWLALEGFILDHDYLKAIQQKFSHHRGAFCGYGVATPDLHSPPVEWQGKSTYIQQQGVADDFGIYASPDEFYAEHGTNLRGLKRWFYQWIGRHLMNWNVARLRTNRSDCLAPQRP